MVRISKCKNEHNCPRAETCYRVHAEIEEPNYMKFYNLCKESNNYQWYWGMNQEIIPKEEGENNKENTNG